MTHLNETYPRSSHDAISALPLYAPFLLLIRWMLGWAVQHGAWGAAEETPVYQIRHPWRSLNRFSNRKERRRPVRAVAPGNNIGVFLSLVDQSQTKTQFLEKVATLSAIGRIGLFGIRYWHKRRLSMTKLTPFNNGGWSEPASAILHDGLWDVHGVPD